MTTDPFAPPVDAVHAVQPDGELFVWKPHPHIVIEQARGVFSLPFAEVLGEFFRPILAARDVSIHIFADFESLTYNTREARQLFDRRSYEPLHAILKGMHILFSAKVIALGVSAFKHDMGDGPIHTYSERASFTRSYERVVEETRPDA